MESELIAKARSASRRPPKEWDIPGVEPPEPTGVNEVVWLEPFPDALLDPEVLRQEPPWPPSRLRGRPSHTPGLGHDPLDRVNTCAVSYPRIYAKSHSMIVGRVGRRPFRADLGSRNRYTLTVSEDEPSCEAGRSRRSDASRDLRRLTRRPQAVGELAETFPISRPAVSQHLRILKEAGLLTVRTDGTRHIYAADPSGIAEVRASVERLWRDALVAFKRAAESSKHEDSR